jgi:hypothetical protein
LIFYVKFFGIKKVYVYDIWLSSNNYNHNSSSLFLIEPSQSEGIKTVSLKFWKKEDLAKKLEEAMTNAMKTIQDMAQRVNITIQKKVRNQNSRNRIWTQV